MSHESNCASEGVNNEMNDKTVFATSSLLEQQQESEMAQFTQPERCHDDLETGRSIYCNPNLRVDPNIIYAIDMDYFGSRTSTLFTSSPGVIDVPVVRNDYTLPVQNRNMSTQDIQSHSSPSPNRRRITRRRKIMKKLKHGVDKFGGAVSSVRHLQRKTQEHNLSNGRNTISQQKNTYENTRVEVATSKDRSSKGASHKGSLSTKKSSKNVSLKSTASKDAKHMQVRCIIYDTES
ncbi:unnamed protein product [Thelazia callipaeda]|uniref:BZIP domain-containing protein n=1 Tax=Thelazia callipaeda TaxID=103827 RepID=A0A0N5CMR5_THECL|nr:unnamed protein product [Thelazia callipaeda]